MAAPTEPTDTEKPAGKKKKEPPQKEEKEVGGERKYQDQKEKPDNENKVPAEKSIEVEEPKKQMIDVRPRTSQVGRVEIVEDKNKNIPETKVLPVKKEITQPKYIDQKDRYNDKVVIPTRDDKKQPQENTGDLVSQLKQMIASLSGKKTESEKPDFDTTPVLFGNLVIDDNLRKEVYKAFHENDMQKIKKMGFAQRYYNYNFENAKFALVNEIQKNPYCYGGILRVPDGNQAKYIICLKSNQKKTPNI
jgi:hypothetical protein